MSSFGEELRRERELRRITLREVADATKINLRYLEALDKNEFKHLPGGVFNRGFVRAYAQYIGVDPEQMVTAYLMEEQTQAGTGTENSKTLLRGTSSDAPVRGKPAAVEGSGTWVKMGVAVVLAAALIAAGVFVYVKFFGGSVAGRESSAPKSETTPATRLSPTQSDAEIVPGPVKQSPVQAPVKTPSNADAVGATTTGGAPASRPPANGRPIVATIYVDRAQTGRLNCDNRQIDLLNGMPPGTRFELSCRAFLIVDTDDGGALRIGWPDMTPTPPGEAGVPLAGHRIDVPALPARSGTGDRP